MKMWDSINLPILVSPVVIKSDNLIRIKLLQKIEEHFTLIKTIIEKVLVEVEAFRHIKWSSSVGDEWEWDWCLFLDKELSSVDYFSYWSWQGDKNQNIIKKKIRFLKIIHLNKSHPRFLLKALLKQYFKKKNQELRSPKFLLSTTEYMLNICNRRTSILPKKNKFISCGMLV